MDNVESNNARAGAAGNKGAPKTIDAASLAAGLKVAADKVRELEHQGLDDPEQEPEALIGQFVRVTNLENQQHYNGLRGKVLEQIPTTGRWVVEVEYEGQVKQLKLRKDCLLRGVPSFC